MATMLPMPSQIETYEEMSALSARMVEAAKTNDWDTLVALELSVAKLRDSLMADDRDASLDIGERDRKMTLIQRILDDDAEIRRHTEPWMEHVRQLLGDAVQRRRVEGAYNAGIGALGGASR